MNVVFINGSPKKTGGATGKLLDMLAPKLGEGSEVSRYDAAQFATAPLQGADALVIAFPLYVDGLPAHLLRTLEMLEPASLQMARGFCGGRAWALARAPWRRKWARNC